MRFNNTGTQNTALGNYALQSNSGGSTNTATGYKSMNANSSGQGNAATGYIAMQSNVGGSWNTALGSYALNANINADGNTAIGHRALDLNTAGADNAAVGFYSLKNNTGSGNTGLGTYAGDGNTTGSNNTAVGYFSDISGVHTNATAIGYRAIVAQDNSIVLGGINGVNGATANTFVGIGTTTPTAPLHVANITATTNANAAYFESNNSGAAAAFGGPIYAKNSYTGGSDVGAVNASVLSTVAGWGIAGYYRANYTGLYSQVNPGNTGGFSTFGVQTYANGSTGATNYGIYSSAANGSTNWAGYFVGNVFATGTYTASDAILKSNIKDYDASALSKIMSLQTKSYDYNVAKYESMHLPVGEQFGFLAQDLEKVFPQLVTRAVQPAEYENGDKNGKKISDEVQFKAVNYTGLIPVLTKAVQEQQQIIDKQQKQIDELLQRVSKLENK